jgi:hypothetical protein
VKVWSGVNENFSRTVLTLSDASTEQQILQFGDAGEDRKMPKMARVLAHPSRWFPKNGNKFFKNSNVDKSYPSPVVTPETGVDENCLPLS